MLGKKSGTDDTKKSIRHNFCSHVSYNSKEIIKIPPTTTTNGKNMWKTPRKGGKSVQFQWQNFVARVIEENIWQKTGFAQSLSGQPWGSVKGVLKLPPALSVLISHRRERKKDACPALSWSVDCCSGKEFRMHSKSSEETSVISPLLSYSFKLQSVGRHG